MRHAAGFGAGDPLALPGAGGDLAIQGGGEFQRDQRTVPGDAQDETGQIVACLVFQQALLDRDAGRAEPRHALAVHPFIGIEGGDDHARDPGLDQGIGAGRGAAPVAAGLQGHVGGGAAGGLPGHG